MSKEYGDTLYPVVLKVPAERQNLSGRDRTFFLKKIARQAVICSGKKKGIALTRLENNSTGAPLPEDGNYWSLSHKPEYVAGVTAKHPVGIDIEELRPVKSGLYKKVAEDREWQLGETVSDILFYRYWTAKEAVLKAAGIGIRDLSRCKINCIMNKTTLIISYQNKHWTVEQAYFNNYVVAVAGQKKDVQWAFPD